MLLLIGIVLYFAIDAAGGREGALFGLIPAAVGIANLVYAAMLWKKEQERTRRSAPWLPPRAAGSVQVGDQRGAHVRRHRRQRVLVVRDGRHRHRARRHS